MVQHHWAQESKMKLIEIPPTGRVKKNSQHQLSSQDGSISKHALPPCATTERITTIPQNK